MQQVRAEVEQRRPSEQPRLDSAVDCGSHVRPVLGPDEILARVRAEIERRRSGEADRLSASGVAPAPAISENNTLPHWRPAAPRLPDKPQYLLRDLLCFDDADFVDVVYEKLLKRRADEDGKRSYLEALRSGVTSKVEILGLIRFSEEGRRRAVHVDGLLLPYKLHSWRHRRVVGWFVGLLMAVARLPRLALRLQGMEASAAREAQELGRLLDRMGDTLGKHFADADARANAFRAELAQTVEARMEGLRALGARAGALQAALESQYESLHAKVDSFREKIESVAETARTNESERVAQYKELREALDAQAAKLNGLAEAAIVQADELRSRIQSTNVALRGCDANNAARYKQSADRLAVHEAALSKLDEQAQSDHRSLRALLDRLAFLLDASAQRAHDLVIGNEGAPSLEEQYASFEQTFRGDREEIKARVAHYLGTLAAAGIRPGDDAIIVDLGSGRGEWLEVLAEHGYRGRGVDSNRGMLEASRARGHEVFEADALEYLRDQPENSLASITSMHMVEHMPHAVVVRLLDEARRVLRPGGVLILETPNPENVLVGSCMFYMDPTHLHPIPPPLLQWTVQMRGFEQVAIERLSNNRGSPDLVPVAMGVPGAAQINQMVAWFTAPPDYAVIARKPVDVNAPAE